MTQDCSYNELYALQVTDDSMEPEFPAGCVIVIEPSQVCATGAYVVATVDGERWFRQYHQDGQGRETLSAIKPGHPPIELAGRAFRLEGVIVQRTIRRQVKHYRPYLPHNGESKAVLH
jgi:SOS-response transcriptional repressor LexA